jgi:myosin heavy subunit
MANKIVGFTINIDGIDSINDLNKAIKQTEAELKNLAAGTQEFADKAEELARLKAEQKAIKKQQDDLNKSFIEQSNAIGSYDKLSNKLNRLRKEYKDLAVSEKASTKEAQDLLDEIQKLDKQLKDVDASAGQFQRNVGNYPKTFAKITRSLVSTIPGFEAFDSMLRNGEGNLTGFGKALIGGFVAFQAGKFIVQAVGQLNELVKKIDETKNAVANFSGASGDELNNLTRDVTALAQTFGVDANEINEAAKSMADKTGVSFADALKQVETGLLSGTMASDEFLSSVSETPEIMAQIGEATGEYAERQKDLLGANKELAQAQIETAAKFADFGNQMQTFGTYVQTYLLKALLYLFDLIKPIAGLFFDIGKAVYDFIQNSEPLKTLFTAIGDFFQNLPFIFAGNIEALKQLGKNFVNFFKVLALDAQIFGENIKSFFGANVDAAIEELRKKRAAITDESRTVGEAWREGYENARKESEKSITDTTQAETAKRTQINAEAIKKAKEQAEQAKKDREKFLNDEAKFREQQLGVIANLQQKAADLTIQLLKDEQEKRKAEAKKAFDESISAAKKQTQELNKLNKDRESEAVKTFGEASQEVAQLRKQNNEAEQQAQSDFQAFTLLEEQKYQEDLIAIQKDGFEKAKEQRTEAYNKRIDEIATVQDREINALEQARLKGIVSEEQYNRQLFDINKKRIDAEIEANKKMFEENEKLKADGVMIDEELNASLLDKNQKLYTDLLNLEKDYTDKSGALIEERIAKSDEELQARRDAIQKNIEDAANYTTQALDLVNQFAQAADEQRNARFAAQEEQNQKAIEDLNERLQNATGLERRYLQQQLQREEKNADQIAKAKEEAEQEAAKREKAIAIIQSIIQGALAVSKAIASAPPPFNIPAIVAAGIQAAAQTALIAAQPLATGGVVGKLNGEIVQFASGGVVKSKGNIKPLSNGDNVLATLKTGEVVLNKQQQNRIGYSTLKSAKIPGFAAGGVVGAPTSLIAESNMVAAEQKNQASMFENTIQAINGRMDRLQVVYTASTDYDVELSRADKKTIKANASF